jgi:predicted transcriptional regulator
MPIKRQALDLVEQLPENASWDDLMYEVYVRQKIEAGLAAAIEGRTVSHDEVKRRFAVR